MTLFCKQAKPRERDSPYSGRWIAKQDVGVLSLNTQSDNTKDGRRKSINYTQILVQLFVVFSSNARLKTPPSPSVTPPLRAEACL